MNSSDQSRPLPRTSPPSPKGHGPMQSKNHRDEPDIPTDLTEQEAWMDVLYDRPSKRKVKR